MASNSSDENARLIDGKRHKHPLHPFEKSGFYKCRGCKQLGANEGYICQLCPDFKLHKPCVELPHKFTHPFYEQRPLRFRARTKLLHYCDACGKSLRGFMFQSYGKKGLRLHPLCMSLPPRLFIGGHQEHFFKLFVQGGVKYKCKVCKLDNKKWRYQCEETACGVELDMNCAIADFYGISQRGIYRLQDRSLIGRTMERVAHLATGVSLCTFLFGAAGFCYEVISNIGS